MGDEEFKELRDRVMERGVLMARREALLGGLVEVMRRWEELNGADREMVKIDIEPPFGVDGMVTDETDIPPSRVEGDRHAEAVRAVLVERGKVYAPGGDRHMQAELSQRLYGAALKYFTEGGKRVLGDAEKEYIGKMLDKVARGIAGGLGGVYHSDNGLDVSGYEALLASVASGKRLEDVL